MGTIKIHFTQDGDIFRMDFFDLLGKKLTSLGEVPLTFRGKLEIITIDAENITNLVYLITQL